MKYGFGVDLGGTTVKIAFFNIDGLMLEKWEIPTRTENGGINILPDIAASIKSFITAKSIDSNDIIGTGIGVPGPVNNKGVVNRCVNLGWDVFNVAESLSSLLGMPVKAGNDANVAALGEYWVGGGKNCESMVMVTLGTGVGGGIIIDGNLLHGSHGAGGEIGHMQLVKDEKEPCGCGNHGCAEQYCSATGIVRLATRYLENHSEHSEMRKVQELTAKAIFDFARDGDPGAIIVRENYYSYLGEFLAKICCVTDPEMIVLGGGVSKAGKELLKGIRPYFEGSVFFGCRETQIALATLGNDAGAYGAVKLVFDSIKG